MADILETIETDFVIVGAGSAGCVLAGRLSEDPATSVTLLEAGGRDWNAWIHIPIGYDKTIVDPRLNWLYETERGAGIGDRPMGWPRGKVLGGSSSINGLLYIRGQARDYDQWRQCGNADWSYDDVLPTSAARKARRTTLISITAETDRCESPIFASAIPCARRS